MPRKDPVNWMLSEAIDSLARAERLRQQFFNLQSRAGSPEPSWEPPIDVLETDREFLILVALPGVDPKAVEVSVLDNFLTVKGERKANHDPTGKDCFVREVTYGAFQRSVTLPEGVDAAQVEATYANGMLEVRVPAPRAAVPRMIEVKAA